MKQPALSSLERHALPGRALGFTLIEVIVVLTILGILAAIAIPNYVQYVSRGYRSEARSTLVQAAQWMERFRTERGTYTGAALPLTLATSPQTGAAKYNLTIAANTGATYTLQATPVGTMNGDVCGNLTLTNTGLRNQSGGTPELCWGR